MSDLGLGGRIRSPHASSRWDHASPPPSRSCGHLPYPRPSPLLAPVAASLVAPPPPTPTSTKDSETGIRSSSCPRGER
uniref:Uncharacterized protein n=1 Tax=Leersia perrieri TaxID=77586 RepID=A0A0D9W3T9_9ORYZ